MHSVCSCNFLQLLVVWHTNKAKGSFLLPHLYALLKKRIFDHWLNCNRKLYMYTFFLGGEGKNTIKFQISFYFRLISMQFELGLQNIPEIHLLSQILSTMVIINLYKHKQESHPAGTGLDENQQKCLTTNYDFSFFCYSQGLDSLLRSRFLGCHATR